MSSSIGSATSADANSLIRSLMDQSESTRSLVTSNGGLTKPTQSQPPATQVPRIGASVEKPSASPSPAAWNDSVAASVSGRSRMLSASAQSVRNSSNAQMMDATAAAEQTSKAAGSLATQVQTSILAQANAAPEAALRLLA